jgi:hypothetical protein
MTSGLRGLSNSCPESSQGRGQSVRIVDKQTIENRTSAMVETRTSRGTT